MVSEKIGVGSVMTEKLTVWSDVGSNLDGDSHCFRRRPAEVVLREARLLALSCTNTSKWPTSTLRSCNLTSLRPITFETRGMLRYGMPLSLRGQPCPRPHLLENNMTSQQSSSPFIATATLALVLLSPAQAQTVTAGLVTSMQPS